MSSLNRHLRNFYLSIAALSSIGLSSCSAAAPEQPGTVANPRLAALLQAAIEAELSSINSTWSPGMLPAAPQLARQWLTSIAEVTSQCTGGPDDLSKKNRLQYTVVLSTGKVLPGVTSGITCQYQKGFGKPLVARFIFNEGKVVQAFTDGRELEAPIASAQRWVNDAAKSLLAADQLQRRSEYFGAPKTPEESRKQWQ